MAHYMLDITDDTCPITYVKTKLFLEKMGVGEVLDIRLRAGEPLENVPRTLRDQGHEVLELAKLEADIYRIVVRKSDDAQS